MKKTRSKSRPSFFLPESMIKTIAQDERITVLHVGALLTIACHTDRSGIYSSAGAYAIRNTIAIGDQKAAALLKDLSQWDYLKEAKKLAANSRLKKEMPPHEGRAAVRWIVPPDDNERKIWFPANIVRGVGKWSNPLADLRRCGNLAARMLLNLYRYESLGEFGGINPTKTFYQECTNQDKSMRIGLANGEQSYLFVSERDGSPTAWRRFANELNMGSDENGIIPKPFWDAIIKLTNKGFIYECLTVFTGTNVEENGELNLLYPLHTFNRYRHAPTGEESLAGKTANIAKEHDIELADNEGLFDGVTFAFVADDEKAQLVGVYRLRFRDVSEHNHEGKSGWKYLQMCRIDWQERLS